MVNVIGLGYIGLPTALMMASHGVEVTGTDLNSDLVQTLNHGQTTFKEKGLDELFAEAINAGIVFSTEYQICDTYIVSVPTPYDRLSKKIDAGLCGCSGVFRIRGCSKEGNGCNRINGFPWNDRSFCTPHPC